MLREHREQLESPGGGLRSRYTFLLPRGAQVVAVHVDTEPGSVGSWLTLTTLEKVEWNDQTRRRFVLVKAMDALPLEEGEWAIYVRRLNDDSPYGPGYHVLEIVRPVVAIGSLAQMGIGALAVDPTAGPNV